MTCSVRPVTAKTFVKRILIGHEFLITEDRKAGVLMALEKLDDGKTLYRFDPYIFRQTMED